MIQAVILQAIKSNDMICFEFLFHFQVNKIKMSSMHISHGYNQARIGDRSIVNSIKMKCRT